MLARFVLALCPLVIAACPSPTEVESTDGPPGSTDGGSESDPEDETSAGDGTDDPSTDESDGTDGVDDTGDTGMDDTDGTDDTGGPLADCGNGLVEGDELCDAPNDPDLCTETCTYVPGAVVWEVSEATWIPKRCV